MGPLEPHELIAPPLLWSEVPSLLHELSWRGEVDAATAEGALERFLDAAPKRVVPKSLLEEAWALADRLGWAKTYDAEYVALASLRGAPLVTLDARLHRGAARAITTLAPHEL